MIIKDVYVRVSVFCGCVVGAGTSYTVYPRVTM